MRFRFEQKFLINSYTAAVLKDRVRRIMRPDSNSKEGSYIVNNLYFDDIYDSFYYAKQHGKLIRDKYRLRHYNNDLSYIRLERKHKKGLQVSKVSVMVTEEQYGLCLAGDLSFIDHAQEGLWQNLGIIKRLRGLRTTAVFAYSREVYVYDPGTVRITFDSPPFGDGVYRNDHLTLAYGENSYAPLLLEVKYTGFLPEIIKQLLSGLLLTRTNMSKYCIARERGLLPYGKI